MKPSEKTAQIRLRLSHRSYLRDPEETALGRRIITESILLIDELGFEQFTFRKLAQKINSTEASVYRYFESKHKLLIYLVSWYWAWVDYRIGFEINNIAPGPEQLKVVTGVLSNLNQDDPASPHINESVLHRIVVAEAAKAYLTKHVDDLNKEGLFLEYKTVSNRIAELLLQINPHYPFAHALATTLLEAAHQQVFFAQHLPSLTEAAIKADTVHELRHFLEHLAFAALAYQE